MGLSSAAGVRMAEAAVAPAAAAGDLAARPGMHRLHRDRCCAPTTRRWNRCLLDVISLDYHETLCVGAGQQALDYKHAMMAKHKGKYVLVDRGRHADEETAASTARSAARPTIEHGARGRRGRGRRHRHRLVRVLGRHPVGRSQSDRRGRHADRHPRQAGDQHSRLSAEPVQLPLHRSLPVDLRPAAGARPAEPAEIRVRPPDPRELRAARRISMRGASRSSSATKVTARASASTSSAAKVRRPTPTVRRSVSATSASARGRSAPGIPASAAPRRKSAFRKPLHALATRQDPDAADRLPAGRAPRRAKESAPAPRHGRRGGRPRRGRRRDAAQADERQAERHRTHGTEGA